jgi:hypothetical protein
MDFDDPTDHHDHNAEGVSGKNATLWANLKISLIPFYRLG